MKRLLSFLLALVMVISLAACGSSHNDDEDDDDRDSDTESELFGSDREVLDPAQLDEDAVIFLCWFGWYGERGKTKFNCEDITPDSSVLDFTFTHAVPFDNYPGPEVDDFTQGDPRGRFSSCSIYDAEKTDWILKNIFHYSQRDIDAMRAVADEDELSYYYEDGSYYIEAGGVGGGYDVRPCYVETDGDYYYITYASYFGDGEFRFVGIQYAVMSKERIDGDEYWTLHYWNSSVPEPEYKPDDRILEACAGSWVLDEDGLSELEISNVTYCHFELYAGFFRLIGFTADAVLQSDGRTAVFSDNDGGDFSGWMELGEDKIVLHVFCCPDYTDEGFVDEFFDNGKPFVYSRSSGEPEPFAEPEGADPQAWVGTWLCDNGEIIQVTEATEDYVKLIYSTMDAAGGSMHHTNYTLSYTDGTKTVVAEDEAVIEQSGYRLVFTLGDDFITLSSRYPDKTFYRD